MPLLSEDVRLFIRRLFFTERRTIDAIAERTGFSVHTVRRALVIDGGVTHEPGPYHQEHERDR